ncbi:MAG: DUF2284 domain-containing protein [Acutalibacteraceae bacterium]
MDKILEFVSKIKSEYGVNCGVCDMAPSIFHAELRAACEANSCGNYGKCHTCPPLVGTAEECIKKASAYKKIIVFQKIYTIEDSYDFYGMVEAQKQFCDVMYKVADTARDIFENPFILGAGGCKICESCAATEGKPCRFKEKALASLESYCIQVSELSALAGMKYINGQDTVTYFGSVFLR